MSGMVGLLRLLAAVLCLPALAPAQVPAPEAWPDHIMVLVDVSGSMRSADYGVGYANVRQARDLVDAVLSDSLDMSRFPQWSVTAQSQSFQKRLQPGGEAVAGTGASVYLGLFGDRPTTNAELKTLPSLSVSAVFPLEARFTDQTTNMELARANTMVFAKKHGISSYLILEVTDAQAEEESFRSKQDEPLIDEFHSENCQTSLLYKFINTRTGLIPYKGKYYQLKVNCWKVELKDDSGSACVLSGLTVNPSEAAPGTAARVQWLAANWKSGDPFKVSVLSDAGQLMWSDGNLTSNGTEIPGTLKEGRYQVMVALESGRSNTVTAPFSVKAPAARAAPGTGPGTGTQPSPKENEIVVFSPQAGVPVPAGTVKVAWKLRQDEPGAGERQYKIQLISDKSPPVTLTSSSMQSGLSIPEAGEYRLTISSDGLRAGSLRFSVESDGGGGWIWLLILAAAAAAVVYFVRRKSRDPEDGEPPSALGRRTPPPAAGFEGLD